LTSLSLDSPEALLEHAAHLAHAVLAPLVERPEQVLPPTRLEEITDQAIELGLLSDDPADVSLGGDQQGLVAFSAQALRLIAGVNAGVALHLHRLALTTRLRARLGLPTASDRAALSLLGHYGLGRQAQQRNGHGARDDGVLYAS
jgi:hypothetical protein